MALILNEEQQSLKDIAKEFLQKNAPVTHFREIRDTQNELGYDQSLWSEMVNLGWSGILIPEEYGGFDFGMVGMGSIFEEMGRTLTPSPLFSTGVLGASLLTLGGDDKQKQNYQILVEKIMPKRILSGVVISSNSNKTITVDVTRRIKHKLYKKIIRQTKKYHAHDENNEFNVGDTVSIIESKPISKLKKWKVMSNTGVKS